MANELALSCSLAVSTSGVLGFTQSEQATFQANLTAATGVFINGTMATSTGAAAIPMGAIVTASYAYFKNLDGTNNIKLRIGASGADFALLLPGESLIVRLAAATPYAISAASTPQLYYFITGANA